VPAPAIARETREIPLLGSLQLKFSALVAGLLVLASVSLALIATQHERAALEGEVEKRGRAVAENLAGAAKEPLLRVERGELASELTLERLIEDVSSVKGVVGVRLLGRGGRIAASLVPEERETRGVLRTVEDTEAGVQVSRDEDILQVAAPVRMSGVFVGEAQIDLDLTVLVTPVVRSNTQQLTAVAVAVVFFGVLAGVVFVALLVGPLRRLRLGVEQLAAGQLSVRVPPTSRDEVGELTRAFNEMGDSLQQKERIQSAFGRYVNDYVLSQLLDGSTEEGQAGIEREVTVLFADIRGFTNLSEGLKAPRVVSLLNEIFQLASDRILENGGTIDKFMGDSVMAYFGAPVPQEDHSLRAVQAAIEILQGVHERNCEIQTLADSDKLPVELGIGIHSGVVVVGNIGSDRRTDFTAVGDAVNVAHRLEKLARPSEILVSEAVQRRIRGAVEMRFEGERQLSGREEPVHVYAVQIDGLAKPPTSDADPRR
jgi:adenylate cyclase